MEPTADQIGAIQRAQAHPELDISQRILKMASSQGFDVNQYKPIVPQESETFNAESAARGAAQGVTLGFGDELSAGVEKIIGLADVGLSKLGITSGETGRRVLAQPQEELVGENRALDEAAQDKSAVSFFGGQILGALTAAAPITAGAAGLGIAGAVPAAATGIGVLEGVGRGTDSESRIKEGLISGGITAATLGLSKVAPGAIKSAYTSLGRRAAGFIKSTIKKAGGVDKVNDAVDVLLKNGLIKGGLKKTAEKVNGFRIEAGKTMSRVYDKVIKGGGTPIDQDQIIKKVLDTPLKGKGGLSVAQAGQTPLGKDVTNVMEGVVETLKAPEFQGLDGLLRAKDLIGTLGFQVNRNTPKGEVLQKVWFALRDAIDEAVEEFGKAVKDPSLIKDLKLAKESYRAAKIGEIGLDDAIARASGNRILGLTDLIFGANVLAAGNPSAAVGVVAAKKVLESKRLSSAAANGLRKLFNVTQAIPESIAGAPVKETLAASGGLLGQIGN